MKKLILTVIILLSCAFPVSAMDFTAPEAPSSAQKYMPPEQQTFAEGIWYIIKNAISDLQPSVATAGKSCLALIALVMLLSLVKSFSATANRAVAAVSAISVGLILLEPSNAFIQLGIDTVTQLSDYGKLLLPVMTAALASQGGATASVALYTATSVFSTLLSSLIANIIVPMLYIFLCLRIANCAIGEEVLSSVSDLVKQTATWCLKTVLYVFTGYISITGVVSGSTDAVALKATKLTIAGSVPVVGSILSDASETVLIGAGILKNTAGIYGLLAILAIWIGPFLKIGIQFFLLNITCAVCATFGNKDSSALIKDFSTVMGLLLAMTGAVCVLLLISTVCFMKGVAQ